MEGRKASQPTHAGFESLLGRLDADPDRAAAKYAGLRRKLVRLFEVRGAAFADDLADETLSRVATRLGGGLEIRAEDPYRYCCGVAFLVFKEVLRRRQQELGAQQELQLFPPPAVRNDDPRLESLEACLEELPADSRELILHYYAGEKSQRIAARQRQAEALGISATALRLRAHRIRLQLEACVERRREPAG